MKALHGGEGLVNFFSGGGGFMEYHSDFMVAGSGSWLLAASILVTFFHCRHVLCNVVMSTLSNVEQDRI